MHIAELWRYPVKSMAGELLQDVPLGPDGLAGDRLVRVRGPAGKVVTSRTHPGLLGHQARLGSGGAVLVDGRPFGAPEVAADVERAAGPGARLSVDPALRRFDVLPLLVATDGAIAHLGLDRRRFRPNVLVGGVQGLSERGWVGRRLQLGECEVEAVSLRPRCVMTTFDPDTLAQDVRILRRIVEELDGSLALDCRVVRSGVLRVGDEVRLIDP